MNSQQHHDLPPFSVLMSVYSGNTFHEFERAVESATIEQQLVPKQLVIVRDGPVDPKIQEFLDTLPSTMDVWFSIADPDTTAPEVRIVPLDDNVGLARALNAGLGCCDYEIVARADADDISLPARFSTMLPYFASDYDGDPIDVLGCAIQEFTEEDNSEPGQVRLLPAGGDELNKYAKLQSPVHHPAVIYRKSAVLKANGYPQDAGRFEDYLLWERMMLQGNTFMNLPDALVLYRADEGAYERRGGAEMSRDEKRLQKQFLKDGFISPLQYVRNVTMRSAYRMIPVKLREKVYRTVVAKRNQSVDTTTLSADASPAKHVSSRTDRSDGEAA